MNSSLSNSTLFEHSNNVFALFTLARSVLGVQFLLGFSLHSYIAYLLHSKGVGVDISVVFMLNHSAAEIVFSMGSLLYIFFWDDLRSFVIRLMEFVFVVSMSARSLFVCFVSFERYLAVIHPVSFLKFKPLRYRIVCSGLGWMCAVVLGISTCISFSVYTVFVVVYFFSFLFEFFCCVSILRTLSHPGPRDIEHEQVGMSAAKKKAFQIVCINLLTCLIQNIPVAVSYSLEHTLSFYDFLMADVISTAISTFLGFVQPVFFLYRTGKLSFTKCP